MSSGNLASMKTTQINPDSLLQVIPHSVISHALSFTNGFERFQYFGICKDFHDITCNAIKMDFNYEIIVKPCDYLCSRTWLQCHLKHKSDIETRFYHSNYLFLQKIIPRICFISFNSLHDHRVWKDYGKPYLNCVTFKNCDLLFILFILSNQIKPNTNSNLEITFVKCRKLNTYPNQHFSLYVQANKGIESCPCDFILFYFFFFLFLCMQNRNIY